MSLKKKNIKKKITKGGYRSMNPFIVNDKISQDDKSKLESALDKCVNFNEIKDKIKVEDIRTNEGYQCITPLFTFKKFIGNNVNYILLDSLENVIEFNLLKKDEDIYRFKVTVKYDVELKDKIKFTDDIVKKVQDDVYLFKFIDETCTNFYSFVENQGSRDWGLDENYIMDIFSPGYGLAYSELYKIKLLDLVEDPTYFQKFYFKHEQQYITQNSVNVCSTMIFFNLFVELLDIVNRGPDVFVKSVINTNLTVYIDETLEKNKPSKPLKDKIDSIFDTQSKNNTKKNNNTKSKTKKSKEPLFATVYNKLQDERKTQFENNFMELILNILIECKVFDDVNNNIDIDLVIEYIKNNNYLLYVIKKIIESNNSNIKTISTKLNKKSKDIIISSLCISSLFNSLKLRYNAENKIKLYKKIVYGLNYLNTAKLYRALLSKHEKINEIKSNNDKKDQKQKKIYEDMKKDLNKLNLNIVTNEFEHFYTLIRSLHEMIVSISDIKFKQLLDYKYCIYYDTFNYRFTSMIFQSYFIDLLKIDYTPLFPLALQSFKTKFNLYDFKNFGSRIVDKMIINIKILNNNNDFIIIKQLMSAHINYNGVNIDFANCVETCLYNTIRYLLSDLKKRTISSELIGKIPGGNLIDNITNKLISNNNHSEYLEEFTLLTVNHPILEYYKKYDNIKYELYGDINNFTKALSILLNMKYNDSIKPLENLILIFNYFDKNILPSSNDEKVYLSDKYCLLLYRMHADFNVNVETEDLEQYFTLFNNRLYYHKSIFGHLREYYGSYEKPFLDIEEYSEHCVKIESLPKRLTQNICTDISNINTYHNTFINKLDTPITDIELLKKLKQFEIILNLNTEVEITPEYINNCTDLVDFNGIFSNDSFNNITFMKLDMSFNNPLPPLPNCKKLIFDRYFNQPLNILPKLKTLITGYSFNQNIVNILPECEYIDLGEKFNSDIDKNALPKVKILTCDRFSDFNKPIKNLPECEKIYLGNNFNSNISINALPKATDIELGAYNLPILKNMFPKCTYLKLSPEFNSIVEEGSLPNANMIVNFGLDKSLSLVPNILPMVEEIRFNENFNSNIEINSLPNAVNISILNKNYNKPIKKDVLNKCIFLYIYGENKNSNIFKNMSTIFEKGFAPNLQTFIIIDDNDNYHEYYHIDNNNWETEQNSVFPKTIELYHN
jgi:hypothetical protein